MTVTTGGRRLSWLGSTSSSSRMSPSSERTSTSKWNLSAASLAAVGSSTSFTVAMTPSSSSALITSPDFLRMAAASSPTVTDSGTLMSSRLISTGGSGGVGSGLGAAGLTSTLGGGVAAAAGFTGAAGTRGLAGGAGTAGRDGATGATRRGAAGGAAMPEAAAAAGTTGRGAPGVGAAEGRRGVGVGASLVTIVGGTVEGVTVVGLMVAGGVGAVDGGADGSAEGAGAAAAV